MSKNFIIIYVSLVFFSMLTIDAKADCTMDVDRSWSYNTSNTHMVWTFKNKSDKTIMYSGIGLKTKDDKIMYEKKTKEYLAPYSILRIEVYVGNLNLDVAGKGFTRCEYQEKPKLEEPNYNTKNLGTNYGNYSKPAPKKDSDNSWVTVLGIIVAIIVGLYNRSFFMGGGVLFGAACLVALLEKGPAIILIIGIPATVALFYFGNKELESREKK